MTIAATTIINTKFGKFKVSYHEFGKEFCVSFSKGNLSIGIPIVRLHSACLFGESFHSLHCDCKVQITETMRLIEKNGNGTIIYRYQEGRGIGLKNKIRAMEIERTCTLNTVDAFRKLGFTKADYRDYKIEIKTMRELKVSKKIKTFSGNNSKITSLRKSGYIVEKIIPEIELKLSELAKKERAVKEQKLGYSY